MSTNQRIYPKCGKPAGKNFCGKCGAKISPECPYCWKKRMATQQLPRRRMPAINYSTYFFPQYGQNCSSCLAISLLQLRQCLIKAFPHFGQYVMESGYEF